MRGQEGVRANSVRLKVFLACDLDRASSRSGSRSSSAVVSCVDVVTVRNVTKQLITVDIRKVLESKSSLV